MDYRSDKDGCLVVSGKTALPPRCVHTNESIPDHRYRTREIPYTPSWMVPALLLLSPAILLIFVPIACGGVCKMRYGLSPSVYRKYLVRKVIAAVMIPAGFILPVVLLIIDQSVIGLAGAPLLFFGCFYGGFALLHFWAAPLRVTRIKDRQIWIKGCSSEFLASLSQENASATQ